MAEAEHQVASPCVRNCCLNDDDVCLGCFRTLAEIRDWSQTDNSLRRRILINAAKRRQEYPPKPA